MKYEDIVCNLRQIVGKYPLTHDEWQAIENAINSVKFEKKHYREVTWSTGKRNERTSERNRY